MSTGIINYQCINSSEFVWVKKMSSIHWPISDVHIVSRDTGIVKDGPGSTLVS